MMRRIFLFAMVTGLMSMLSTAAWAALPAATPAVTLFHWRPFLAPFHSVVLHFPIGFVTLAFLLELYCWWRPSPEVRGVVAFVLALAVSSAGLAAALGLMRAGAGDYDEKTLTAHQWSGLAVVVLTALAFWFQRLAARGGFGTALNACYRGTLAAAVGSLIYAGHQGGNLTHGSKYLVKNAPDFVKSLVEDEPEEPGPIGGYANEKERFFAETIHPIFQNKCSECHGAEKQKGGYRLDVKEIAMQGGTSGEAAIKPGDPMHSQLVRLITLSPHDDDVMPPEGKSTLTAQEIVDIIHWIGDGAHFPEKSSNVVAQVQDVSSTNSNRDEASVLAAPTASVLTNAEPIMKPVEQPKPVVFAKREGRLTFARDIKPIFEAHCVICHGPEKQKRGLRLDTLPAIVQGARGGEVVLVPGDPSKSAIYQRITIPEKADPADEHMPPPHKKLSLTTIEISSVAEWIQAGAP